MTHDTAPRIRPEAEHDHAGVRLVHEAAFPTDAEARLVHLLRMRGKARISLVAIADGAVVGHVLFSPVTVAGADVGGLGLAPLAVLPRWQRHGVGKALVTAGLDRCRGLGCRLVVVLGDPSYYGRFGFANAGELGLQNEYGADQHFMALRLRSDGQAARGLVRYAPELAEIGDWRDS